MVFGKKSYFDIELVYKGNHANKILIWIQNIYTFFEVRLLLLRKAATINSKILETIYFPLH